MPAPELLLHTRRLDLVAATLAHLDAELAGPDALASLLGVAIPSDWPPGEYDRAALEFFRAQLVAGGAERVGWYSWYALTRDPQGRRAALVAGAGYLGPPAEGTAEIGYSVMPSARRQGFAAEIAAALVGHAFTVPSVRQVIAHTTDANVASTRVLLRCGFERVGPGAEPGSVRYRIGRGAA